MMELFFPELLTAIMIKELRHKYLTKSELRLC